MAMLLETQLLVARGLRNVQRVVRPLGSMEAVFPKLATGRSFVDVGALWNVHGKIAFLAESSGASSVTAVDLSSATDEYLAEHERRHSKVRFVQGDLHDEEVLAEIGPHDVVFRNPDLGEQHNAVTVKLTGPTRLSVDLRKKP